MSLTEALLEEDDYQAQRREWSPRELSAIRLYQHLHRMGRLPVAPYVLRPGWYISDPARFHASLERDIQAGPGVGRAQYGVLLADLEAVAARASFEGTERVAA